MSTPRDSIHCASTDEDLQDLEDGQIADQRLMALQTGKTQSVPLSAILKRYGTESDPENPDAGSDLARLRKV